MNKQAPSLGRIVAMLVFALSCFGILVYLWLVFGGSTPLRPEGYRVDALFPEATSLADEADVRISGVRVGRVKESDLDLASARTRVTIEIDDEYAPIPADARATLRQKTLLGETYVELTPGTRRGASVPDGGLLAPGQIAETVELDEILRTFDPRTRAALRTWLEEQGLAYTGRGRDLSNAIGNLAPFARSTREVLAVLDRHDEATSRLVRDTGEVFDAISERQGQLRGAIESSERVFSTTASRDRALQEAIRALPTFADESRLTVRRVSRFASATDPLVTQLRPAARELTPTLLRLRDLAPDLRALMRDLDPLFAVSRRGLPALESFLDETRPLLARIHPAMQNLVPMLDWLGLYRREIASFFALDAAATQATDQPLGAPRPIHYLRTTNPVNPEVLAAHPRRLSTNRSNPYLAPDGFLKLPQGLEVLGDYLCTQNPVPALAPDVATLVPASTIALIDEFIFAPIRSGNAAPPCRPQAPLGQSIGQTGVYPHIEAAP